MKIVVCSYCGKSFSEKGIGSHIWRIHGDGVNFKPSFGKVAWNKGLTKETSDSMKRCAEKLMKPKTSLELELDDDGKLKQRWLNKCINAKQEGLECLLTFDEYCQLVKRAGLKSSQLGFKGQKYVLARYNDEGDYTFDNCRFITQSENCREKKLSPEGIEILRRNAAKMNEYNRTHDRNYNLTSEQRSKRISEGIRNSESYKKRIAESARKQKERIALMDPRKSGERNSQYGTFWITDGCYNRKWRPEYGPIPENYYRGRVCNKLSNQPE